MSLIEPPGATYLIQSIINSAAASVTPSSSLQAASIIVIIAITLASVFFIFVFLFVAYWCPFARCFWLCTPCLSLGLCNAIYCFYACCPWLDLLAQRNLEMRSREAKVYIQDMFTTPDGKIIHMSNMGPVVNCPRILEVGGGDSRSKLNGDDVV